MSGRFRPFINTQFIICQNVRQHPLECLEGDVDTHIATGRQRSRSPDPAERLEGVTCAHRSKRLLSTLTVGEMVWVERHSDGYKRLIGIRLD